MRLKVIFLVSAILLLILVLFIKSLQTKNSNQLILSTVGKTARVDFHLSENGKNDFSKILTKFELPQGISAGIEFEIDATSQARLAYVSPIHADFGLDKSKIEPPGLVAEVLFSLLKTHFISNMNAGNFSLGINFSGRLSHALLSEKFESENVKVPKSTNLVVALDDLRSLVKSKFRTGKEFSRWIDENLKSSYGQYLVIFGDNANLGIIFRKGDFAKLDFEGLKNIDSHEGSYKEEMQENILLHLFRISHQEDGDLILTVFQSGDLVFLADSRQAALELLASQKVQSDIWQPLFSWRKKKISGVIVLRNEAKNPMSESFYQLFEGNKNLVKIIERIEYANLVLNEDEFSGLISLK